MKQIIMVLALICVLAFGAGAKEVSVILEDSIAVADTVEGATRVDTAYSGIERITGGGLLQFHSYVNQLIGNAAAVAGGSGGGDQTSDTLLIYAQHSFNRYVWATVVIDTLFGTMVDTNSASTVVIDLNSAVYGEYWRMMYIHRDYVGEEVQDSLANVNYYDCHTWLIERVE